MKSTTTIGIWANNKKILNMNFPGLQILPQSAKS